MIRLLNLLAILGLIGSAIYSYSIKYETIFQAEKLTKVKSRIQKEHDMTAVLKAEWQLLNRPDRLQSLADKHLADIRPLQSQQLTRFSDLPSRPERGDEIGKKLEALGMMVTATPKDLKPFMPTTTGSLSKPRPKEAAPKDAVKGNR
jgi:hypothetical protein